MSTTPKRDRRGGRPAVPAEKRRTEQLTVRWKPYELAYVKACARAEGLTLSAYIRERVQEMIEYEAAYQAQQQSLLNEIALLGYEVGRLREAFGLPREPPDG